MGGPLEHVIAAKAIAFQEASTQSFQDYTKQILINAKALAESLMSLGVKVITDGTDNHIVLIDVQTSFGLNGRQCESALSNIGITVNRNSIPNDTNGPWYCSGIRLGTPALTTRKLKTREMEKIGKILYDVLKATNHIDKDKTKFFTDERVANKAKKDVEELLQGFPLYEELGVDICTV